MKIYCGFSLKLRSWRGWSETKQQKGSSGADRERKTNNNKPTWTTQGKRNGTQEHQPGLFGSPKAQEPPKSPKARGLGPDMVPNTLKNIGFLTFSKTHRRPQNRHWDLPRATLGRLARHFIIYTPPKDIPGCQEQTLEAQNDKHCTPK